MRFFRLAWPALFVLLLACLAGARRRSPTFGLSPKERMELALRVKDKPVALTGTERARVQTNKGEFTFQLYSNDAPRTVKNFIRLAEAGFYDGLIWHRYVGDFVIQGGDPLGDGTGGAGYTIDYEESGRSHVEGAVGMARSANRNSASCQFYICLSPQPQLDGYYCVFGRVTKGMEVVKKLLAQDTILRITIER